MPACKPDPRQWTPALRTRFLDHLSASGDVRAAAAHCGLSRQSVYKLRRRDPAFARQWDRVREAQAGRARMTRDLSPVAAPWAAWLGEEGQRGEDAREFLRLLAEVAGVTGVRLTPAAGRSQDGARKPTFRVRL